MKRVPLTIFTKSVLLGKDSTYTAPQNIASAYAIICLEMFADRQVTVADPIVGSNYRHNHITYI